MAQVSIMIRPNISEELIFPEASGWRAMESTAWAVACDMPSAAPMPVSAASAAARAIMPKTVMVFPPEL